VSIPESLQRGVIRAHQLSIGPAKRDEGHVRCGSRECQCVGKPLNKPWLWQLNEYAGASYKVSMVNAPARAFNPDASDDRLLNRWIRVVLTKLRTTPLTVNNETRLRKRMTSYNQHCYTRQTRPDVRKVQHTLLREEIHERAPEPTAVLPQHEDALQKREQRRSGFERADGDGEGCSRWASTYS